MTIWRMRIACWVSKATNTQSEYVILILFHYNNGRMNAPQPYVKFFVCVVIIANLEFIFVFPASLLTTMAHRGCCVMD